jgi:hypothetical protein
MEGSIDDFRVLRPLVLLMLLDPFGQALDGYLVDVTEHLT